MDVERKTGLIGERSFIEAKESSRVVDSRPGTRFRRLKTGPRPSEEAGENKGDQQGAPEALLLPDFLILWSVCYSFQLFIIMATAKSLSLFMLHSGAWLDSYP